MPRYVQLEVDTVRQISKQTTSDEESSTEAVPRDLILSFLSDADERIQSRLLGDDPNISLFDDVIEINTVSGQRAYELPSGIFAGDDIRLIEFSRTGQDQDYAPIERISRSQANNWQSEQYVDGFFTQGNTIVLSPVPLVTGQKLRLTYVRGVNRLDIRRGKITATPNDGTSYTEITLADDEILNELRFAGESFLCVCDKNGVIQRYNIEYDSYDAGSQTFTLAAGQLMSDGAISVGDYVTAGQFTTTQSSLPRFVDRYREAYAAWKVMKVVSNTDAVAQEKEVSALESDVVTKLKGNWSGAISMPIGGYYV